MSRYSLCALACMLLLTSCSAQKKLNEPEVRLKNVRGFVQKAFPGVSGDVWYFLNYRLEFDLETSVPVEFISISADSIDMAVKSVMVGNRLVNTHLNEQLASDTSQVKISVTHQIYHTDGKQERLRGTATPPKKLILKYKAGGEEFTTEVYDITVEPTEFRPGVGRE